MLPEEIQQAGKLDVATSLYPPVDYYDEDGETLIGFDAEIVEEIGTRLGVEINWNVIDFANVLPGIESKQYDFATDLNDTAEREQVVDFVTEFQDGTSILVASGNPEGISDLSSLCGKTVVMTKGSVQLPIAEKQAKECTGGEELKTLTVPDDPDALLAVKSGRADAYLVNTLAGSYSAQQSSGGNDFEIVPGVYEKQYAGMIFPKESTQLRDAIQAALQSLIDDGTYGEIMEKYGVGENAIETSEINAAGGS